MRCKGQDTKRKALHNNRGTTMVEVMVAFVVLAILTGIMYGMIAFCSTLRKRSEDTNRAILQFGQELYTKDTKTHISEKSYVTSDNVPLFYLAVDAKSTSADNFGSNSQAQAYYNTVKTDDTSGGPTGAQKGLWISLYQIEATVSTYLPEEDMDQEHMIVPKAISFIHKEDR